MNDLLPNGSIVRIEESPQKFMIYGRKQTQLESKETWDYVACPYPYGYINNEYTVFFNHPHISKVLFRGYEDEEERDFRESLQKMTDKE